MALGALVLFAGVILPQIMKELYTTSCPTVTEVNTRTLAEALHLYALDHDGVYPRTLDALWEGASPYVRGDGPPLDPWGRAYHYRPPSEHTALRVWSWGADGLPGGEGEDRDVDQHSTPEIR